MIFSRSGRSPRATAAVLIVPLATYWSREPSTSTTPKPVVCSPGSMPRILMPARSQPEVPAYGVEEHRRRETQRRHPIEQPHRAGDAAAIAPMMHAGVALERLHHEGAETADGRSQEGD